MKKVMIILRKNIIQGIILLTFFLILFGQTIVKLFHDWMINDNYSHGFLVPFISAYMIWQKRIKLVQQPMQSPYFGILVILVGMFFFLVGNIGAELFISRSAIVITIFGLCLFYLGRKMTAVIVVPLAYLMFMIPLPSIIWNKIAFPMQLLASKITTAVLQFSGIPVYREGNILHLSNMTLEVVDACSGLRSLTSLLALSAAFAFISKLNNPNKWILFLAAIPVAVLLNIFRLTATAYLAQNIGPVIAQGFLHEFSGILVFVIAIIMFYLLYLLIHSIERKRLR